MRLQQMIIGMVLLLSFGVSQAGETRHYFAVSNESYSVSELGGISYRYGYDFSNLISVELDYSVSDLSEATATVLTADSIASVMLHLNRRYESINTYFAIGGSLATMTMAAPAGDDSFSGLAYGVGIELYGSKNTAISFQWLRRIVFDDTASESELDAVQIGIIHHFDFSKPHSRY